MALSASDRLWPCHNISLWRFSFCLIDETKKITSAPFAVRLVIRWRNLAGRVAWACFYLFFLNFFFFSLSKSLLAVVKIVCKAWPLTYQSHHCNSQRLSTLPHRRHLTPTLRSLFLILAQKRKCLNFLLPFMERNVWRKLYVPPLPTICLSACL